MAALRYRDEIQDQRFPFDLHIISMKIKGANNIIFTLQKLTNRVAE